MDIPRQSKSIEASNSSNISSFQKLKRSSLKSLLAKSTDRIPHALQPSSQYPPPAMLPQPQNPINLSTATDIQY